MSVEQDQELGQRGLAAHAAGEAAPVEAPPAEMWDTTETPDGKQTYVVQMVEPGSWEDEETAREGAVWVDVARQHFPMKTQIKTVLTQVVGLLPGAPAPTDVFRVLNVEAARPVRLRPKPPVAPEYEVEIL